MIYKTDIIRIGHNQLMISITSRLSTYLTIGFIDVWMRFQDSKTTTSSFGNSSLDAKDKVGQEVEQLICLLNKKATESGGLVSLVAKSMTERFMTLSLIEMNDTRLVSNNHITMNMTNIENCIDS